MLTSLSVLLALAFYLAAMKMTLNLVFDSNFDETSEGRHCMVLVTTLCILVALLVAFCATPVVNDILWKWAGGPPIIFEALLVASVEVALSFFPFILLSFKSEIRKKIFG